MAEESPLLTPGELPARGWVRCRGVVRSVTFSASGQKPQVKVVLGDEHPPRGATPASLVLVWLGRAHLPGITTGRPLQVEGRVFLRGQAPHMFNPRYELVPHAPES